MAGHPARSLWDAKFWSDVRALAASVKRLDGSEVLVPPFVLAFLVEHNAAFTLQRPYDLAAMDPARAPRAIGNFRADASYRFEFVDGGWWSDPGERLGMSSLLHCTHDLWRAYRVCAGVCSCVCSPEHCLSTCRPLGSVSVCCACWLSACNAKLWPCARPAGQSLHDNRAQVGQSSASRRLSCGLGYGFNGGVPYIRY